MEGALPTIVVAAMALTVLVVVVAVVARGLGLFRHDKATVQIRALSEPAGVSSAVAGDSLNGPRLRETSAPAWAARKIDLVKPMTTIGRSLDNDIVLVGDAVSAAHCRVEREGSIFKLVDLGSTNKSWVNGVKVKNAPLYHGDQIRVGATTFVFELPPEAAKAS